MRSAGATNSGLPGAVVFATNEAIACLVGPSFHEGSGSAGCAELVATQPATRAAVSRLADRRARTRRWTMFPSPESHPTWPDRRATRMIEAPVDGRGSDGHLHARGPSPGAGRCRSPGLRGSAAPSSWRGRAAGARARGGDHAERAVVEADLDDAGRGRPPASDRSRTRVLRRGPGRRPRREDRKSVV